MLNELQRRNYSAHTVRFYMHAWRSSPDISVARSARNRTRFGYEEIRRPCSADSAYRKIMPRITRDTSCCRFYDARADSYSDAVLPPNDGNRLGLRWL